MSEIFQKLRAHALEATKNWQDSDFLVRGLWKTQLVFKPNPSERAFQYTYILALIKGQGCCYCERDDELKEELVGRDARELIEEDCCFSIAILDAIYSSIAKTPAETHEIRGNPIEKTHLRNTILADEAERLLGGASKDDVLIVNVGVVGDLVHKLAGRGFKITATDLDEKIIGKTFHDVEIEHGSRTMDYIRNSDLAVISGMTIATKTLDEIVSLAKEHNTKLLMFAETGANFGEEYCRTIGIDAVISEPFPFYIFQGVSIIDVYRKE